MDAALTIAWPVSRLPEAVETLARESGLVAPIAARPAPASDRDAADDGDGVDGRVKRLSRSLDFEVESCDISYGGIAHALESRPPALIKVPVDHDDQFVLLLESSGRMLTLLTPDGGRHRVSTASVAAWLRDRLDAPLIERWERMLDETDIPPANRAAARHVLLEARLREPRVTRCWMLRPTSSDRSWHHRWYTRLPRRVFIVMSACAARLRRSRWIDPDE
jgi:hypothetical protein